MVKDGTVRGKGSGDYTNGPGKAALGAFCPTPTQGALGRGEGVSGGGGGGNQR